MKIELKSVNVAGVSFRPANVIDVLENSTPVRLVAEPENAYDKFAIKVEAQSEDRWNHIGYIPKKDTWIFHILRKAGVAISTKLFVNHDAPDTEKLLLLTSFEGDEKNQFNS